MTVLMQEIETKASRLSAEERELLAERLIASIDKVQLSPIDEAWIEEVERRYSSWKAGHTVAIPSDQALAKSREYIKK